MQFSVQEICQIFCSFFGTKNMPKFSVHFLYKKTQSIEVLFPSKKPHCLFVFFVSKRSYKIHKECQFSNWLWDGLCESSRILSFSIINHEEVSVFWSFPTKKQLVPMLVKHLIFLRLNKNQSFFSGTAGTPRRPPRDAVTFKSHYCWCLLFRTCLFHF